MLCTTHYSKNLRKWAVIFYDDDGHRAEREPELFDDELEATNRAAEIIALEGIKYVRLSFEQQIKSVMYSMLHAHENMKTYTDCEEYRREGAVSILEELLERFPD